MNRRRKRAAGKMCSLFDESLPSLLGLDGEGTAISLHDRQALLRHESGCPRCHEALQSYKKTLDLLRALPRKPAPADFLRWVKKESP